MRNTFSELQTAQWKWASAAFASHLCYCTALIVGKLLASQCNLTKSGLQSDATQLITALIAVFIESASIYTGWAIFYCVSYEVQSLGRFIARDCSPAVAGIAFGLIIVQARLTWPQKTARDRTTVDALEFASHHTSDVFTSIAINVNAAVREAEEDGQHDTSKGTLEPLRILLDEF
ncbi:hypothetical protein EVJ58_g7149 [Rhodofomes roseus]|uniref:Uncharacterized protein n=1 Tax=Rhodofomes roseus TaxID=34475 RepID=A0A4Y9Y431_9APHY|nr:hypothetical protein EVJ58_g7149 [Rhodofomes roseus]